MRGGKELWTMDSIGRALYRKCEEVGFDNLQTSFKTNQLLTGHGNMLAYLQRFRLRDCATVTRTRGWSAYNAGLPAQSKNKHKANDNCSIWKPEYTTTTGRKGGGRRRDAAKINQWADAAIDQRRTWRWRGRGQRRKPMTEGALVNNGQLIVRRTLCDKRQTVTRALQNKRI